MTVTRTPFAQELHEVKALLVEAGTIVDSMTDMAMQALREQREDLTKQVIRTDDKVDALDLQIEAECLRLIALQQPVASDLRVVGTALKAVTDIERIGDYAVDIAKIGRRLARHGLYTPIVDMDRLATLARAILRDAIEALMTEDLDVVHRAVTSDDMVDDLYHEYRTRLIEAMQQDPSCVVTAANLLLAAKYLERLGDHAVNIAERVYYMVTGKPAQLAKTHKTEAEATTGA